MSDEPHPRAPRTDLPGDRDPVFGRRLADRYRVEELLARGGMARIYRGVDERLGRKVAVKILAPPYADDASFVDRFLGEGRAAASVSHANLVHVYDSGSDGEQHYIVMELLARHRSLRDVLAERGRLPAVEAAGIVDDVLSGLTAVHERGLVHCDVKCANVLLGAGPTKLIDFGIATAPGAQPDGRTSIGSLQYMSPEHLGGRALSPRSDVFGAGVVLYEALTGRLPYPGETPEAVAAAHRADAPVRPSALAPGIPRRLEQIVLRAVAADPEDRFASAREMGEQLEAFLADAADETHPVTPVPAPAGYAYVPPAASVTATAPRRAPLASEPWPVRAAPAPPRRRRAVPWSALWTAAVLGAAVAVVLLVVVPLLRSGGGLAGPSGAPTVTATPTAEPAVGPGQVRVPDTIGLSADEAIATARDSGLDWTLFCEQDESRPEAVYQQEPAPDTVVERGSRFVMYWPRYPGPCGGDGD
jgi:tRNA A-37 threonylcarbamoyl transferase component Bud32